MNQKFPKDEFDQIPYDANYYGIHRDQMPAHKERSGFKWVAIAGLAALVIGAFAFFLLPILLDDDSSGPTAESSPSVSQSADPTPDQSPATTPEETTPEETSEEETTDPAEEPTEDEPTEDDPFAEESEEPADVNYNLTVEVYQTGTALTSASEAAFTLQNQGFYVPVNAFWQGNPITASTVFYADESQRGTAEAVAEALGIPNVEPGIVPTVVVVLSNG